MWRMHCFCIEAVHISRFEHSCKAREGFAESSRPASPLGREEPEAESSLFTLLLSLFLAPRVDLKGFSGKWWNVFY